MQSLSAVFVCAVVLAGSVATSPQIDAKEEAAVRRSSFVTETSLNPLLCHWHPERTAVCHPTAQNINFNANWISRGG